VAEEVLRTSLKKTLDIGGMIHYSLPAGSPLSHTRERRRAKRSGGKESVEEALSRLAASPLDFALAATLRALVLQREPARRLDSLWIGLGQRQGDFNYLLGFQSQLFWLFHLILRYISKPQVAHTPERTFPPQLTCCYDPWCDTLVMGTRRC